jgi:hypothetical protein
MFAWMLAGLIGCTADHQLTTDAARQVDQDSEPVTISAEAGTSDPDREAGAGAGHEEGGADAAASDPAADTGTGAAGEDTGDAAAGPEAGVCTPGVLSVARVLPEVVLVLDRSQSMAPLIPSGVSCVGVDLGADAVLCQAGDQAACARVNCASIDCGVPPYRDTVVCGGSNPSPSIDKWSPTVEAFKQLTRQHQAQLSFGLTIFPGVGANAAGTDLCAPGTELVAPAANAAGAIARALDATSPSGATPTEAALSGVLEQAQARSAAPGATVPPRYALLVTDGQATCPNARGNTINADALAMDHALTLQALDALRAADIMTYVFAYEASIEPSLAAALREYAMHGGTGEYRPVRDAAGLVAQFASIAAAWTQCSYQLEARPSDPEQLLVTLDRQTLGMNTAEGWSLDGTQNLTLHGRACAKLQDGAAHVLAVTATCTPRIP